MQFCSRFSAGTDLRAIPAENLEQKVEKTSNKTDIVLVSDGFCRFVFFLLKSFEPLGS